MKKDIKVAVLQYELSASRIEGEKNILGQIKKIRNISVDMVGLPEDCVTYNYEESRYPRTALTSFVWAWHYSNFKLRLT